MLPSQILQFLKDSQVKQNLAHAYLFCGPKGISKKETACSFFSWLLKTDSLVSHPDFLYITDAKEIKINQIRQIKKFLSITSYKNKYKCILITEAEKMNSEAQNAFLKTLEEPSPNSIIILTTSHKNALLKTILSRLYSINFSLSTLVNEKGSAISTSLQKKNYIFGRRGLAENKKLDIIFKEQEKNIKFFLELEPAFLCQKFAFIKKLAQAEEQKVYFFLESLLLYFRDQLLNTYQIKEKIIFSQFISENSNHSEEKIELIIQALKKLNLNLNKEMILEELFLRINSNWK